MMKEYKAECSVCETIASSETRLAKGWTSITLEEKQDDGSIRVIRIMLCAECQPHAEAVKALKE